MAKRQRSQLKAEKSSYFTEAKEEISFISSGCTLLDCALGGGWALGKVANVVGDKSTGKTALGTEALINFLRAYPNGKAAYRDAEAAFEYGYAEAMGLPINEIDFGNVDSPFITVEEFARDVDRFLDQQIQAKEPGIYVLDSLDSLSDETEMENDIGKGTYGTGKAKTLSMFFRKSTEKLKRAKVLLFIVSQVRDNIGAMMGEKHKRSGGRALDFYASQIVWLAHTGRLKRTINKVERPYGISVKAQVKKNKVGLPFREAEFEFIFGYGIEDVGASVEWMKSVGRLADIDLTQNDVKGYLKELEKMSNSEYRKEQETVSKAVKKAWAEIETTFLPSRSKYG
jgi:recombination protein RecA